MANVADIETGTFRTPDHDIHPIFPARWSPRAMSGEPITRDELHRLLEAARWAPSSYNEQPWVFLYALRGTPNFDTFMGLLVDANKAWASEAGALLVVTTSTVFTMNGKPNPVAVFDAGSAWENLALQASEMGLVAHGMAGFDADAARKALSVPDDRAIPAMIALGKPGEVGDLPEKLREMEQPSPRKAVSEISREGGFA